MKRYALLLLAVCAGPVAAAPVHVALKASAVVSPNADGFFSLAAVADVSGGEAALRVRLAAIPIGRAPLSGETRRLTRGDLALKLRQAGCNPDKAAILEGAATAEVTVTEIPAGARLIAPSFPSPPSPPSSQEGAIDRIPAKVTPPTQETIIHRGDAVAIVIQSGFLTITASGIARENGGAGQTIRVHREGVMTDLSVQVVDAQTVQLEI